MATVLSWFFAHTVPILSSFLSGSVLGSAVSYYFTTRTERRHG